MEISFKMIIQQDGKIMGIGRTGWYSSTNDNKNIIAVRYKTNGSLDSSYGTSGISTINFANTYSEGTSGVLQTDSKLLISAYTAGNYALLRLKINGSLDSTFGTGGYTITDFDSLGDKPYGVVLQSGDSSIVVAGSSISDNLDTLAVSLAAYNKFGIKQSIAIKIKRWLQHHNAFTWEDNNNVNSYIVQRSHDGIHFSSVARINAGNSSNTYADPSPLIGSNYYRLQTTSTDGAVNYSNVIAVTAAAYDITIAPNPAKNNLQIQGLSSSNTKLTVVDFMGNIKLQAVAKVSSYNINIASLAPGNYLLKIESNDAVVTKKFVKE